MNTHIHTHTHMHTCPHMNTYTPVDTYTHTCTHMKNMHTQRLHPLYLNSHQRLLDAPLSLTFSKCCSFRTVP